MENTNYIIKYGIIKTFEMNEIENKFNEKEINFSGYIAVPCFLIQENNFYLNKNNKITNYKVVYLVNGYNLNEIQTPEVTENGFCINTTDADELFDTYDDAIKVMNEKNIDHYKNNKNILSPDIILLKFKKYIYEYTYFIDDLTFSQKINEISNIKLPEKKQFYHKILVRKKQM